MIEKVSHIGIAVQSLTESLKVFEQALGLPLQSIEVVEDQGVRVAMLPVGETRLELIEPMNETGPIASFLRRKGEGIHHLCLEVDDLPAALEALKQRGVRLVDEQPRIGAGGAKVAFLHPSSTHGVLLELHEEAECS